jgi:hypothetical protein
MPQTVFFFVSAAVTGSNGAARAPALRVMNFRRFMGSKFASEKSGFGFSRISDE